MVVLAEALRGGVFSCEIAAAAPAVLSLSSISYRGDSRPRPPLSLALADLVTLEGAGDGLAVDDDDDDDDAEDAEAAAVRAEHYGINSK